MRTTTIAFSSAVALLALLPLSSRAAESKVAIEAAEQINSANQQLRNGQVDQALAQYEQITPGEDNRDVLLFNQAVALYRKGELEAASSKFTEAAGSVDAQLAAASKYNLGNCSYAQGLALAEKDKPGAIAALEKAISLYRGSLRITSNNADARANIELAAQLIEQLMQQQQDQQQQDQQQQDQQQQDQQQQDQQQQDQQQQDQQQQDQQQQDQQKQDQQQQDQQQQDQQQQDQEKQDQEQQDQQKEQQPSSSGKQGDKQKEQSQQSEEQAQPTESNESAATRPMNSSPTPPKPSEGSQADAELPDKSAAEEEQHSEPAVVPTGELQAADEQEADQQANLGVADANAKPGKLNKEEALKMLQAVRDRDMLRRLRQEQIERSRRVPVARDW